jgi:histidinol-phosphatase (PHP family)
MAELVKKHKLDYVIGSKHLVYGLDPFGSELWKQYTQKQAYEAYLVECIECAAACDFYDVFGHLGYIAKFCPFEDALMSYSDYSDAIDELLKILVKHGKGLEINTSGIKNTGTVMPEIPIAKRFFELGGEIVTVGSDAHDEAAVGRAVAETMQQLGSVGLKYVCAFDSRKPRFLAIE